MLTEQEKRQQSIELNENYRLLGFSRERVVQEIKFSEADLDAVLAMTGENPTYVWMLRDYMDEKLKEQGKTPRRYSKGIVNLYYPYKKTW